MSHVEAENAIKAKPAPRSIIRELEQAWREKQRVVLQVNGHDFVIRDEASFVRVLAMVDRLECVEAIGRGIESMKRGEGRPVAEVLEELRRKYDLPRQDRA